MHMTDNEFLLALSSMLDKKLDARLSPIENQINDMKSDIQSMKSDILSIKSDIQSMQSDILNVKNDIHNMKLYQENIVLPRLETIESCYTDTYLRYKNYADRMHATFEDVELLKKVVTEHSTKLAMIS